jgi:hypothetical protein
LLLEDDIFSQLRRLFCCCAASSRFFR